MGTPSFRFQQFEIFHDRCAMKVGTDGVLLGAWARVEQAHHILDIGTGSGLIAIMAAQRALNATLVGIDVDSEAVVQARENGARSPFSDRLSFECADVREFCKNHSHEFDCLLCNPPYYPEDTLPPDDARALARHTAGLSFHDLLQAAEQLITADGILDVVLPMDIAKEFITNAILFGFYLSSRCLIRTVERKSAKRVLLSFTRGESRDTVEEIITLQNPDGGRSEAYKSLTKDYYLW